MIIKWYSILKIKELCAGVGVEMLLDQSFSRLLI
jgi:hypothetical protein